MQILTWLLRIVLAVFLLNGLVALVLVVGRSLEVLAQRRRARLYDWDTEYRQLLDGEWR